MRQTTLAVIAVVALAACSTVQRIGPPHFPQLEQASEVVQNPGDRMNAYSPCSSGSKTVEEMVGCMQRAGYDFIPRSPEYSAAECWRLRDDTSYGGGRLPEAFCFRKTRP